MVFGNNGDMLHLDPETNYFYEHNNDLTQVLSIEESYNLLVICQRDWLFTIFNYNIRSFYKHKDKFLALLNSLSYEPDIIILPELGWETMTGGMLLWRVTRLIILSGREGEAGECRCLVGVVMA